MEQDNTTNSLSGPVQIYGVSVFLKIVLTIAFVFIVAVNGLIINQFFSNGSAEKTNTGLLITDTIFTFVCFYFLLALFKYRTEIYPDKIKHFSIMGNTELPFNQIQGFREDLSNSTVLVIHPKNPDDAKITIRDLGGRSKDLEKWVRQNLTDLNAADYQADVNSIKNDKSFGNIEEQRIAFLKRARRTSAIFNLFAIVFSVWGFIFPYPQILLFPLLLILPVIGLGLVHYFRGALKFLVWETKSPYPGIAIACILPVIVMTAKAYDFYILNWKGFWFEFFLLTIFFFILALYLASEIRQKKLLMLLFAIGCAAYSYAAIISLNCILDTSVPRTYKVQILNKQQITNSTRRGVGKTIKYYFTLSFWELNNEVSDIEVEKDVYDRYNTKQDVDVITQNGRFDIPWFHIQ
ncbi:MAG: hypothetical protein ABSC11_09385 [Smithella sp.]|jgi:hypothetical protein